MCGRGRCSSRIEVRIVAPGFPWIDAATEAVASARAAQPERRYNPWL